MKVKDVLSESPVNNIMYRMRDDQGNDDLFGYCAWDGTKLISLDGDSYFLDEEILEHKYMEDGTLIIWIYANWS